MCYHHRVITQCEECMSVITTVRSVCAITTVITQCEECMCYHHRVITQCEECMSVITTVLLPSVRSVCLLSPPCYYPV